MKVLNIWITWICWSALITEYSLQLQFWLSAVLYGGRLRYMFSAEVAKDIVVTRRHGRYVVFIDLKSHAEWAYSGSGSIVCGVWLPQTMWLA